MEIEEIVKRILGLEEEREALKKTLESRADKAELKATLDKLNADLAALRGELAELKKTPSSVGRGLEGVEEGAGFFDAVR